MHNILTTHIQESLYGTTLLAMLIDEYGAEVIQWEPEAAREAMERILGVKLHPVVDDRLHAACTVLANDSFFTEPVAFINICNALSFQSVFENATMPADLLDCAWGCQEAQLLLGEEYKGQFDASIAAYVAQVADDEAQYLLPPTLQFAQFTGDLRDRKSGLYIDDPVLRDAFYQRQKEGLDDIIETLIARTRELLNQLQSLQLRHGEVSQSLRSAAQQADTLWGAAQPGANASA